MVGFRRRPTANFEVAYGHDAVDGTLASSSAGARTFVVTWRSLRLRFRADEKVLKELYDRISVATERPPLEARTWNSGRRSSVSINP
jgi:hypothetical protein